MDKINESMTAEKTSTTAGNSVGGGSTGARAGRIGEC